MSTDSRTDSRNKGILLILLSAFSFALMSIFIKLSGDLPVMQKSFFRNLIAFLVSSLALLRQGYGHRQKSGIQGKGKLKRADYVMLTLRSVFGCLGLAANYYAIDHLPVSEAAILGKTAPFFMIIFSYFFLKEKIKGYQIAALTLAFTGVIVISGINLGNLTGFFQINLAFGIALFGGMSAAAAYTLVRRLGQRGVAGSFIIWFFSGFSLIFFLPFVLKQYTPMTLGQVISLLGAGLAASVGQYGVTFAYRYAPARDISIYDYANVVFIAILGIFIFGEIPELNTILGSVIIFSAALLMFLKQKKDLST